MFWSGTHGLVCLGACAILGLGCQRISDSTAKPPPPTTRGDEAGAPGAPELGVGGGTTAGEVGPQENGGEAGQNEPGTGGTTSSSEDDAGAASTPEPASGGANSTPGAGGQASQGAHAGAANDGGSGGTAHATGGTSDGGMNAIAQGGAPTASSGGATAYGGAPTANTGGSAPSDTGGTSASNTAGSPTANGGSSTASGGAGALAGMSAGGAASDGGMAGTVATPPPPLCTFDVTATLSSAIPTVGVVDWSSTLDHVAHAEITYTLDDPSGSEHNRSGVAPADVTAASAHTLLLGLKPNRNYTFHIAATAIGGATCTSADYHFTTGTLPNAPTITRAALDPSAQAAGFIITTGGFGSSAPIAIVDVDGTVVWTAPGPTSSSRARFDYEARNLWVLAANAQNGTADVRSISLDGLTSIVKPPGFEHAHHDLVALPGGVIATFVWSKSGLDQESDLVARSPDGSVKTLFHVGSNLYAGGQSELGGGPHSYHCNSLAYHAADQSFTIGDRNPSLFVKVKQTGELEWQFGGTCTGAKTTACVPGTWKVNHGHQLLDDGTFLFFNNTDYGSSDPSNADEFTLSMSGTPQAASLKQWAGGGHEHSDTLGDVQRLPNGNTLVTFSNAGVIYELDTNWNVVQTLSASSFGYSEWRETLYGPPPR